MYYIILKRDNEFYPALIEELGFSKGNYLTMGKGLTTKGKWGVDLFCCKTRKQAIKKVKDIKENGVKYFRMNYLKNYGFTLK